MKTILTTFEDLIAQPKMTEIFGPDATFDRDDIEMMVATYVANTQTETTLESVRADYAICENLLSDRLREKGELHYEGYCTVVCDTIGGFLFQCLTHFLGEGLSGNALQDEWAKVRSCFIEAGYVSPDDIAERYDDEEEDEAVEA